MKIIKQILPYIIIVISVVLLRTFVVTPVIVDGDSMDTTLKDGQLLLLNKFDKSFKYYDIVVFRHNNSKLIKRIIGLPGDHIKYEDGLLYVNDEIIRDDFSSITSDFDLKYIGYDTVPEGYYFVLGDNRNYSIDSRRIGLISENDIDGVSSFSLWPFKSIKSKLNQ